ncbi:hypothetical protein GCM10009801_41460 [Streptomyces albiaxialis]|uniref:Solute-binding protein family 3/N-terminal domain-containing protein n=1 Tax=Streptomyces albiaxialis TaxID=329523 RepID=A0ABP5HTP1_9ACTN
MSGRARGLKRTVWRWAAGVSVLALLLGLALLSGWGPDRERDDEPPPGLLDGVAQIGVFYDHPSLFVKESGIVSGFENAFLQYMSKKAGFAYRPIDVVTKEREKVLTSGSADLVIAAYSITSARKKLVTQIGPYAKTRQGVMVREDERRIEGPKDLAGKRVCTVNGSTTAPGVPDAEQRERIRREARRQLNEEAIVVLRDTNGQCVSELRKRGSGIDAAWTDQLVLFGFAERHRDVRVLKGTVGGWQMYAIGMPKGHPKECARLRSAMRAYVDSPEWRRDFQSHFPRLTRQDPAFEAHFRPAPDRIESNSSPC